MVYPVAVGVPVTLPVEASILSPAGNGETPPDENVGADVKPEMVGAGTVMGSPTIPNALACWGERLRPLPQLLLATPKFGVPSVPDA